MAKKSKPEPQNCVVCGKPGGEYGETTSEGQTVCRECHGILFRKDKSVAQALAAIQRLGGSVSNFTPKKHWALCSDEETQLMKDKLQTLIYECVACRSLPKRFQQYKQRCNPVVQIEDCVVHTECWKTE